MNITHLKDSLHLAHNLVGSPYMINGRDPKGFDCWGLVWYFYKQIGRNLTNPQPYEVRKTNKGKDRCFNNGVEDNNLIEIEKPEDNCIVSFSRNQYTIHVGIFLSKNHGCLHATQQGVVCEKIEHIQMRRGLSNKFYLWQE